MPIAIAILVIIVVRERLRLLFEVIFNTLFKGSRVLGLESKEVSFD